MVGRSSAVIPVSLVMFEVFIVEEHRLFHLWHNNNGQQIVYVVASDNRWKISTNVVRSSMVALNDDLYSTYEICKASFCGSSVECSCV